MGRPPGPDSTARVQLVVDGRTVAVPAELSLLDALRDELGLRSPKDGCSPQGQCGCCTVLVDGAARAACVTAVRRVRGRSVTTVDGLPEEVRTRWAQAFADCGASQCGFCTPGILLRLEALRRRRMAVRVPGAEVGAGSTASAGEPAPGAAASATGTTGTTTAMAGADAAEAVRGALMAHLCRCTGWQTIVEAGVRVLTDTDGDTGTNGGVPHTADRSLLAAWRAELEGHSVQAVGADVALGRGGFADDQAPPGALVAVPQPDGTLAVGATVAEARRHAAKVQGRRTTMALRHPVPPPPGDWAVTLQTTWVEPSYLEPDASWCWPGAEPASPLANGGAFGGKRRSSVPDEAHALARREGRPVRVLWSREDVVRRGPKRPPIAAGVRADGTGVLRVGWSPGSCGLPEWTAAVARYAPGLEVEVVEVAGPPVSADLRAAGWAEAAVLLAAVGAPPGPGSTHGQAPGRASCAISAPDGGRAAVRIAEDGAVHAEVWAGEVLDEAVLRSYCLGAVHQALGWVRSEGVAVDETGAVHDLTIRSFGIIAARDMPPVSVTLHGQGTTAVNGSDAVFAATAAAAWLADGLAPQWPTRRGGPGTGTAGRPVSPVAG